jgi:preprotein translocase subunit SecG
MAHILDILSSKYKQYYFIITTGFVFVLFLLISIYLYNKFIKTNNTEENKFKDVANTGNNNREINVIMCHVDWCPHCI